MRSRFFYWVDFKVHLPACLVRLTLPPSLLPSWSPAHPRPAGERVKSSFAACKMGVTTGFNPETVQKSPLNQEIVATYATWQ